MIWVFFFFFATFIPEHFFETPIKMSHVRILLHFLLCLAGSDLYMLMEAEQTELIGPFLSFKHIQHPHSQMHIMEQRVKAQYDENALIVV